MSFNVILAQRIPTICGSQICNLKQCLGVVRNIYVHLYSCDIYIPRDEAVILYGDLTNDLCKLVLLNKEIKCITVFMIADWINHFSFLLSICV